jgi:hypothetical protein
MKKKPDVQKVANELAGGSVFFQKPPAAPATPPAKKETTGIHTFPRFRGNVESPPLPDQAKRRIAKIKTLDINNLATNKYTLAFTEDELEALDDLKTELRRTYGLKVAKNDIVRCGLHAAFKDYQQHGDASSLLAILRKKKPI